MDTIEKILKEMTLEEKVAQMQQISANSSPEIVERFRKTGKVGSFLHVLGKETEGYLAPARESARGIAPLFGIDAIHGHALLKGATVFPSQLAMACSFDDALAEEIGEATAQEVAADGLHWVFSPVLCLGRDLRWGRIDETFGEDPLLASRLGAAIIRGYQKDGLVAACAKHYIGYGEATGGRDSYDTEITERYAREVFLPPFRAAAEAGCMTFMISYGSIDGKPLTINRRWMTEILKEELGFDGFIVSDWDNVASLVEKQHAASDMGEACTDAVNAGLDMAMKSHEFYENTLSAVREGKIPESAVDEAVRRILRVKRRLGLLDGTRKRPPQSVIGSKEHQKLNYRIAAASAVLLKNNGVLPLKKAKKIAVIGPNADDVRAQYGDWTYFSHPDPKPDETPKEGVYTVLKGIREVYGDAEIVYERGCSADGTEDEKAARKMRRKALSAARGADVIVAVLGDTLNWNGEHKDVVAPVLRGRQTELLARLHSLNKPVIAVLVNGKPLVLTEAEGYADAIVETFNGGDMCGLAAAKLLRGEENFSGKLPISFAYAAGSGPNYYNQYEGWHGGKYADVPAGSPYPFGFGLSYSRFVYSAPNLAERRVKRGEKALLTVTVKNESAVDGTETVQLYFREKVCKQLRPIRTLLDYKRVRIPAGESREIVFEIDTSGLGYYDENCRYRVDAGEYSLYVSGDGKNFQETVFELIESM